MIPARGPQTVKIVVVVVVVVVVVGVGVGVGVVVAEKRPIRNRIGKRIRNRIGNLGGDRRRAEKQTDRPSYLQHK